MGSLGPTEINPKTNKPYGLEFPVITIRDMVRAQMSLLDHLGIKNFYALLVAQWEECNYCSFAQHSLIKLSQQFL